jgi:flagellar hook-length control protein FliK
LNALPTPSELGDNQAVVDAAALSDIATDALQPTAALDAAALTALAQQNNSGTATGSSGGAREGSANVTQVAGSRTGGSATTQAPAGAVRREKEEVSQLNQQERVRLVQRVARSFSRLGPEGGQVTLKLHPPQLGVLNMSVRIEGQTMTAKLRTESTAARDAILENLPVLRERLAEQGIEVESFQVEVASDRQTSTDGQSQSQAQNAFDGEASGDSRGGPRAVDYRRLARSGSPLEGAPLGVTRGPTQMGWPSYAASRSLDIRA